MSTLQVVFDTKMPNTNLCKQLWNVDLVAFVSLLSHRKSKAVQTVQQRYSTYLYLEIASSIFCREQSAKTFQLDVAI